MAPSLNPTSGMSAQFPAAWSVSPPALKKYNKLVISSPLEHWFWSNGNETRKTVWLTWCQRVSMAVGTFVQTSGHWFSSPEAWDSCDNVKGGTPKRWAQSLRCREFRWQWPAENLSWFRGCEIEGCSFPETTFTNLLSFKKKQMKLKYLGTLLHSPANLCSPSLQVPHWQGFVLGGDFYLKANPRQRNLCHKSLQQCDIWLCCHCGHSAIGLLLPSQLLFIPEGIPTFSNSCGAEPPTQLFMSGNNQESCDLLHVHTTIWVLEGFQNSLSPSAWPGPLPS